jgi:hypothetical protein
MDVDYDALDPGIRELVRRLNGAGIETCDSGDGVTKVGVMECALPYAHVVAQANATGFAGFIEAHDIAVRMAPLLPQADPPWSVQVTFDLADGIAVVFASDDAADRAALARATDAEG